MSKLTGDLIKKGMHVWVAGYDRKTMETIPVEMIIVTGEVERDSNILHVVFSDRKLEEKCYGISCDPCVDRKVIYLGDYGVRPYNYDDRCTQVFTSEEEMLAAIDMWDGRYPTFVCEDGSDMPSIVGEPA